LSTLLAALAVRVELARKKMLEAGAVSPETAKTAKELGVDEYIIKTRIAKGKGITATADGRYYAKATT
jgi:thiazole synthase ThiGH ThiG subunit